MLPNYLRQYLLSGGGGGSRAESAARRPAVEAWTRRLHYRMSASEVVLETAETSKRREPKTKRTDHLSTTREPAPRTVLPFLDTYRTLYVAPENRNSDEC